MAFIINTSCVVENATGINNAGVFAFGSGAGNKQTNTAGYNIAIGGNAMFASHNSSRYNTAIGQSSLYNVTTSSIGNTAVGNATGFCITSGCNNVAVGYAALNGSAASSGCFNTAIGFYALTNIQGVAGCNTAVGAYALCGVTTGNNNTAIGFTAGCHITSGSGNIYIGSTNLIAGLETASNCILIGSCNRGIYIFGNATGTGILNSGPAAKLHVTGAMYATSEITAYYSDRRLKENIRPIPFALEKLRQINGVTYTPNLKAIGFGFEKDKKHVGVIADEVEKVLPEVVVPAPFDTATDRESITGDYYKTVKYDKIIPLLIESVKELHSKAKVTQQKISELKEKRNQKN
jgi:hypothetical protein